MAEYFVRLAIRKWRDAFEFERPGNGMQKPIIKAACIGFLEVYESLEVLQKEHPNSEYTLMKSKDSESLGWHGRRKTSAISRRVSR